MMMVGIFLLLLFGYFSFEKLIFYVMEKMFHFLLALLVNYIADVL